MEQLKNYRKNIDKIDKKIVKLLIARFKIINKIANFKKQNKIGIKDKKREKEVTNNIKKYSNKTKHQKFLKKIFGKIIDYSKKMQSK